MRSATKRPRRALFSILDIWARPIAFLPILGRIPGSDAVAALWMSHALEKQRQAGESSAWICPSWEWYDATLLSRKEQERARRFWMSLKIINHQRAGGVASPGNALAYIVNVRALDTLIRSYVEASEYPPPRAVPKRSKRALPKRPPSTVPEVHEMDTSSNYPVVLPTEETGEQRAKGVQGEIVLRDDATQQPAAVPAARSRSSDDGDGGACRASKPSPEEWAAYCREAWPAWSDSDISRAYLSTVAGGWRKSRGGKIHDWKAYAAVCAAVWEASRDGQEAAKRTKERARERERRIAAERDREASKTSADGLSLEQREANRRALLSGLPGGSCLLARVAA